MKILIFGTTLLCLLVLASDLSAQSVQKKGYVVLNNGDTLHGWIDYHNWEKNPSSVSFKNDSLSGAVTRYSKYDLQAIEITGFDRYIKTIVEKDDRPVEMGELLPLEMNVASIDTAMLRVLVKGSQFDLYELNDRKPHFFIKKAGEDIKELTYIVSISNENMSVRTQKIFINQLKGYLSNMAVSDELSKKIDRADYKEKYLTPIVNEMNKISGSVEYTTGEQQKKILASFFAGGGLGYSNLKFKGSNVAFANKQFSGGLFPLITVGVEASSPRNLQALALRLEASVSQASYSAKSAKNSSGVISSYAVAQTNISPTFSLLLSFIRKENWRVYAGIGAAWNISVYQKNIYKEEAIAAGTTKEIKDYLSFPQNWTTPVFKLGIKLNKKMSVEADGRFIGSITNYLSWSLTPQTFTGQFRYYF